MTVITTFSKYTHKSPYYSLYLKIDSCCRPSEYDGRAENTNGRKIPTDGLVLRGFYNAITLAVYGTFSKSTAEQLAQAAQQQTVSEDVETSQNIDVADMLIPNTDSSQQTPENRAPSVTGNS